jgi:hypothetical protein
MCGFLHQIGDATERLSYHMIVYTKLIEVNRKNVIYHESESVSIEVESDVGELGVGPSVPSTPCHLLIWKLGPPNSPHSSTMRTICIAASDSTAPSAARLRQPATVTIP